MASIAEQLATAAASPISLKTSPSEAAWPKMPWAGSRGTFSASGWKPPGYAEFPPTHSNGGTYDAGLKVTGGNGYSMFFSPTISYGQIGPGEKNEYRSFSTWLFAGTGANANGYQLRACQQSEGSGTPRKYVFRLFKFVEGVGTELVSAEATMELGGAFAVVKLNGKLTIWVREGSATAWEQKGAEASDTTFSEGFLAIDGTGSNPTLESVAGGTITAPEAAKLTPAAAAGTSTATAKLTAGTHLIPASAAGSSTAKATVSAKSPLHPAAAEGVGNASATLTVAVQLGAMRAAGTSTATLAELHVPVQSGYSVKRSGKWIRIASGP